MLRKDSFGSYVKKTDDIEFCKILDKDYDFICLTETWTNDSNVNLVNLNNYSMYFSHRKHSHQRSKRDSGGLIVYVKNSLKDGVSRVHSASDDLLWLKLNKNFFKTEKDIFLCTTYIAPSNSTYFTWQNIDTLDILEREIDKYSSCGHCILAGDTNCRTKCNNDFITNDSSNFIPLPQSYTTQTQTMSNIPVRSNVDKTINDYGKWLLDLCVTKHLFIVNGRVTGNTIGNFTYYGPNGSSVVDYFITHQPIFSLINYMKVHELSSISDHCAISLNIRIPGITKKNCNSEKAKQLNSPSLRFCWSRDSSHKFQCALNVNQLKLNDICNNKYDKSPSGIDLFTKNITEYLTEISKSSLKIVHHKSKVKKSKQANKPFYDSDCVHLKKDLAVRLKLMTQYPHNRKYREDYYKFRRFYRKSIKNKEMMYKDNLLKQLESLKENDSKSYWSLLDKLRNKNTKQSQTDSITADEWQHYFKKLSFENYDYSLNSKISLLEKENENNIALDYKISEKELHMCISKLKKGRTNGPDLILNEMLISGRYFLSSAILKLFNMCIENSYFPKLWNFGLISPIFKKGSLDDPGNFRGICITSNLGKLFTAILQQRLLCYLNEHKKLNENQAGFIPGHRTTDNIFILSQLIEHAKLTKQPLYLGFIDFRKAFDTIWHEGLLFKLLEKGLGGKFYKVIKSIYRSEKCEGNENTSHFKSNINLAVKLPMGITDPFPSNIGVKQGDCMSPILFDCYIDQIVDSLASDIHHGFKINENTMINSLLYADDLVIFSHCHAEMQKNLDKLNDFCTKWKLTVNMKKSQIIVINSKSNKSQFKINDEPLDFVDTYTYLGVDISSKGLKLSSHNLALKAQKAWFSLKQSFHSGNVKNVQLLLKLFDICIKPILSYGSEIWCPYNYSMDYLNLKNKADHIQLQACKWILHVSRQCTNLGVLAETGRLPMLYSFQINLIKYWMHIVASPHDSLLYKVLLLAKNNKTNWYIYLEKLLLKIGFNINTINIETPKAKNSFISQVKTKLQDLYNSLWQSKIAKGVNPKNNSKMRTYTKFKKSINFEKYLCFKDVNIRETFTKIRLSEHCLNIEVGRRKNLKPEERLCKFCKNNFVEDEFHFTILCTKYQKSRSSLYHKISKQNNNFQTLSPLDKFIYIMNYKSNMEDILKFINVCYLMRIEQKHL